MSEGLKQKILGIIAKKRIPVEKLQNPEEKIVITKKKLCEDMNVDFDEIADNVVLAFVEITKQIGEMAFMPKEFQRYFGNHKLVELEKVLAVLDGEKSNVS